MESQLTHLVLTPTASPGWALSSLLSCPLAPRTCWAPPLCSYSATAAALQPTGAWAQGGSVGTCANGILEWSSVAAVACTPCPWAGSTKVSWWATAGVLTGGSLLPIPVPGTEYNLRQRFPDP